MIYLNFWRKRRGGGGGMATSDNIIHKTDLSSGRAQEPYFLSLKIYDNHFHPSRFIETLFQPKGVGQIRPSSRAIRKSVLNFSMVHNTVLQIIRLCLVVSFFKLGFCRSTGRRRTGVIKSAVAWQRLEQKGAEERACLGSGLKVCGEQS